MLKSAFAYLTDSYSLLENPMDNYILMVVVGFAAYLIAYNAVGWLYHMDMIDGWSAGHILHWTIRLIVFFVIYYAVATVIRIYKWIAGVPMYIWCIVATIAAIISILFIGMKFIFYRNVLKKEKEKI